MININQFKKIFPSCVDPHGWCSSLNKHLPEYNITTNERIASFLAQTGHESGGFRTFVENLNYSSTSLDLVFPRYFKNNRNAKQYERKPEQIANIVYGNRMGNNSNGDGWRYRGRGPIQITGKTNYAQLSKDIKIDVLNNPDLLETDKNIAVLSALWFWHKNSLNTHADKQDIKGMTRVINGGYNGLDHRIELYNSIINMLNISSITKCNIITSVVSHESDDIGLDPSTRGPMIRRGSTGDSVKVIQNALGITPDGVFGKGTENAVIKFQRENGLFPDGVVGPKTIELMISQ